jgi:hypothetical protein
VVLGASGEGGGAGFNSSYPSPVPSTYNKLTTMIKVVITCPHCRHKSFVVMSLSLVKPEVPNVITDPLETRLSDIIWPRQHTRISRALSNDKIGTIGDLVKITERELLRLPNFGVLSLNAVKEKLSELGLKLTQY